MLFQNITTGEPIFWQGLAFTGISIALTLFTIWWFYLSPLKPLSRPVRVRTSSGFMTLTALLVGLSALLRYAGSIWDISEHVLTGMVPGGEDFLWPPHLVIYFSFLLSLAVVLYTFLRISAPFRRLRIFDPRYAIRQQPLLGAIVIAALYAWMSVPGDALWHELYGIELTSWSPPHVMLIIASAAETISAAALLVQSQMPQAPAAWKKYASLAILSLALNELYIIATTDWEAMTAPQGAGFQIVAARPIWAFPVVAAGCAIIVFQLARRLTGLRFAATMTTLAFYLFRFTGMGAMSLAGGVPLRFPLMFTLGALLWELFDWEKVSGNAIRVLGQSFLFSAGFYLASYPVLESLEPIFTLDLADYVIGLAVSTALNAGLLLLESRTAGWFKPINNREPTLANGTQPAVGDR
jgi:hypothetical protein